LGPVDIFARFHLSGRYFGDYFPFANYLYGPLPGLDGIDMRSVERAFEAFERGHLAAARLCRQLIGQTV